VDKSYTGMTTQLRQYLIYWVSDPFWGAVDFLIFKILRYIPLAYVSKIGSFIGSLAKFRFRRADSDAKANLKFLYPDISTEEIQKISNNMWKNIAQTLTEMSMLEKFNITKDSKLHNPQILNNLSKNQPAIFLFPHLGNWELLAIAVINHGFRLNVIYEHVPNRFQRRLLESSRKRIGYKLVSPDYSGTRQLFKALASGESIGMAMDEFKGGKIISPVFSKNVLKTSNIYFAIRLAKRFNAPIVTGFCKRIDGIKFDITCSEPLDYTSMVSLGKSDSDVAELINQQCQRWIKDNPGQWYMLHRSRLL